MQVRELIKSYRTINGLTQQEMADKMNMSKQTYARMEKGITTMTDSKIDAFAKIIGKSPNLIREAAENDKLVNILQDNTNTISENNSETIGLIVNNHYYGDNELNAQIKFLKDLLIEKDKQIALLETLVESLKK